MGLLALAMKPTMPTAPQQIQVLEALRQGPSCLHEFASVAYVARNRVGDLRRLGWTITAVPCRRHAHRGRVAQYELVQEGGKAEVTTAREDLTVAGAGAPIASAPLFPEPFVRRGNAL